MMILVILMKLMKLMMLLMAWMDLCMSLLISSWMFAFISVELNKLFLKKHLKVMSVFNLSINSKS